MDVKLESRGKFTVVRTDGDVTICESAPRIKTMLDNLLEKKVRHVCVDLSRAAVIDSSVIGALVDFHLKFTAIGGELVIMNPHNKVLEALVRTQIHQVIRFVENEKQL